MKIGDSVVLLSKFVTGKVLSNDGLVTVIDNDGTLHYDNDPKDLAPLEHFVTVKTYTLLQAA